MSMRVQVVIIYNQPFQSKSTNTNTDITTKARAVCGGCL